MDLSTLSVIELNALHESIQEEMARREGSPVQICDRNRGLTGKNFRTGATLRVVWATDRDWHDAWWYPTVEAAVAGLLALALARQHDRKASESGRYVDLTHPGCNESYASVCTIGA